MAQTPASAPLHGLTLLNTREASTAGELSARLRALGGRVIEFPLLAFAPPESWAPFDAAWAGLTPATWVVFTSATAVARALGRIAELGHA
ncbi:MAG: uroporphyrinogen-III synthase, partial [Candidatus Lambdaproteobacteria bacterium]|nr:uroporphyrinogen-III synthase [Candidatus Lambdaproteobacteria bacterium]